MIAIVTVLVLVAVFTLLVRERAKALREDYDDHD